MCPTICQQCSHINFNFYFRAIHLQKPEDFFWGNPYAPIWLIGRNPYGAYGYCIKDTRRDLLLCDFWHLYHDSPKHFSLWNSYPVVEKLSRSDIISYWIGVTDMVKCYSRRFTNEKNHQSIYENCKENVFMKQIQTYRPYLILIRGAFPYYDHIIRSNFKEKSYPIIIMYDWKLNQEKLIENSSLYKEFLDKLSDCLELLPEKLKSNPIPSFENLKENTEEEIISIYKKTRELFDECMGISS